MRYAIGIDLGGTNIAAGIVTEDYKLLEKGSVPTKAQRPWQEVAADMARLAMELVEKAGLSRADCAGIGVGSPGICNGDTGEVVYSNNLYWDDVPLCPTLTRLTALPPEQRRQLRCPGRGGRRRGQRLQNSRTAHAGNRRGRRRCHRREDL